MDKIIIYVRPENIINGILFYCIEHYLYLVNYTNIKLCIIFDGDINVIKTIVNNKYNISALNLNNIILISKIELLKCNTRKAIILDTDTYNHIEKFMSKIEKIFLYSNDNNHNARKQDNVYGFYDYQKFNYKERLKLGLQYMKHILPSLNMTFCTYYITGDVINKKLIELTAKYPITYKSFTKDLNILQFKEIIYYHRHQLDRNNRIIIEARHFGNNIILLNTENENDSVNERYLSTTENVDDFIINSNYKVTKDFLEY